MQLGINASGELQDPPALRLALFFGERKKIKKQLDK